jgi:hypothetical protein
MTNAAAAASGDFAFASCAMTGLYFSLLTTALLASVDTRFASAASASS